MSQQGQALQLSLNNLQEARLQSGQTMTDYGDDYADGIGDLAGSTRALRKAGSGIPFKVTISGLLDSADTVDQVLSVPGSQTDMSPTRANAIRLGLMSPDGQTDGVWSSPVPSQSQLEMHVLPPLDQSYYVAPGLVTSSYQQAVAMWSDSRMPWDERAIGFVGAALTSPMMLLEETGRALMNVPYYGNQIGQNAAQFSLAGTTEGKVTSVLQFMQNASAGILGGFAMVPASVSMGAPLRTAEEMAIAQFPGAAAVNEARATYTGGLDSGPVFAGHGGYEIGSGATVVPTGTSLTVYSKFGASITETLGQEIEAGANLANVYKRTYAEGASIPNYTLYPPSGSVVAKESSFTVVNPTKLSDLLKPEMGACQWAACTYNPKAANSDFNFGTVGIGSQTTQQWIILYGDK